MDKKIIENIIKSEWEMFTAVNEDGPRADCQEDYETFRAMREGQFNAWSEDAAASYLEDLYTAELEGRNLAQEKYIHMMKNTAPDSYKKLAALIRQPSTRVRELSRYICDKLIEQTLPLREQFPKVASSGRPLRESEDTVLATSVETYQHGELLTYSDRTLELLARHMLTLEKNGTSLARQILENSVKYYGFETLEQAETALGQY